MDKTILLNTMLQNRDKTLPILTFPAIQMMNINVFDLISNAENQAKAMILLAETYPMSAAQSMMDLSVEAEAFGANVRFFDMDIPTISGSLLKTREDIENLKVPKVGTKRTSNYIEGIRLAKAMIKEKPVFAGCIGPFSLAGRLMDMTEIMVDCYLEPDMVHTALKKSSEFITNYILALKAAGADGVIMAEPAAGLLSPKLCEEFSSEYIKKIIEVVSDNQFVFGYHNCGNTVPLVKSIAGIDADFYHFGNAVDIEDMLKLMPSNKIIMGNLSPTDVFRKGTLETVRKATWDLLERCNKYPNFLISTGCDVPPMTSLDNITMFFNTVIDFYKTNK
jgi:uroporphyrinogen decarboxylase